MTERTIKTKKIYTDKKLWMQEMGDLIYKLKRKYNFYYPDITAVITKNILDVIKANQKKHSKKAILYWNAEIDHYYLVIYCKSEIDIYELTNKYSKSHSKQTRYKGALTFMYRFSEKYNTAKKECEDEQFM
jgi:hypothetical protein